MVHSCNDCAGVALPVLVGSDNLGGSLVGGNLPPGETGGSSARCNITREPDASATIARLHVMIPNITWGATS